MAHDTRTGVQKFYDAISTAAEDTEWLTSRAQASIFNGDPRRRQEIEARRVRIFATLQLAHHVHDTLMDNVRRYGHEVTSLQSEVRVAVTGLRDFLKAISVMPMADETRATVLEQIDIISTSLLATEPPPDSGSGGGPNGGSGG
jgi:hypothetical protein